MSSSFDRFSPRCSQAHVGPSSARHRFSQWRESCVTAPENLVSAWRYVMTAPTKPSAVQPSRYIWKGPALSEARSLPANCYTSEVFYKAEVENIHARGWVIVGRVDEWANPGQYSSIETVGGPVLIVRDD